MHTVAADGMIQLRAPTDQAYRLGNFFHIWGQPLSQDRVGPAAGPVTVFVDRQRYAGDPRNISLSDTSQIELEVGKPLISPRSNGTPPTSSREGSPLTLRPRPSRRSSTSG